ncbi:hypothetical protein NMY22_g7912 [Coprinellus aureogranulatus]|nr:hypothetical protein NMY22_g7912 [Coprinellus aureogranulatus]
MSTGHYRTRRDSAIMEKAEPLETTKEAHNEAVANAVAEKAQFESLIKGFSALCVAAGFIAAIQSQILGYTINSEDTPSVRAVNALFLGGMLIDIMSAMMGYLTIRWLERMRDAEQDLLNKLLHLKTNAEKAKRREPIDFDAEGIPSPRLVHKFMALSLLIPLPFLIIGCICMLVGIYIYVWSQHPTSVAIAVTVLGGTTLPFILCDFCIGRNENRRKFIIRRICELQGDW